MILQSCVWVLSYSPTFHNISHDQWVVQVKLWCAIILAVNLTIMSKVKALGQSMYALYIESSKYMIIPCSTFFLGFKLYLEQRKIKNMYWLNNSNASWMFYLIFVVLWHCVYPSIRLHLTIFSQYSHLKVWYIHAYDTDIVLFTWFNALNSCSVSCLTLCTNNLKLVQCLHYCQRQINLQAVYNTLQLLTVVWQVYDLWFKGTKHVCLIPQIKKAKCLFTTLL